MRQCFFWLLKKLFNLNVSSIWGISRYCNLAKCSYHQIVIALIKEWFLAFMFKTGLHISFKIEQYLSKTTKQIFKGSNKDSGNQRMVVEFIWDAASTVALTLQALPFHRNQILLHSFRTFFMYTLLLLILDHIVIRRPFFKP